MLNITDLNTRKALTSEAMGNIRGGTNQLAALSAMLDLSTSIYNTVADVKQAFGFNFVQSNQGTLTNNQAIQGGNGVIFAPVNQTQHQNNSLSVADIGNTLAF